MESRYTSPYVEIDFANESDTRQTRVFSRPVDIISAYRLQDVKPALRKIQTCVNEGYYAVGYVSYEASPAFDPSFKVKDRSVMPLLWFGIYESYDVRESDAAGGTFHISSWTHTQSEEVYYANIERIHEAIARGETYQVNYTTRLRAQFQGDDYAFYKKLCEAQQGDFNAYLRIGDFRILSASPELFFRKKDGLVLTRPMKGTIGRGRWNEEDRELAEWLQASTKNRAENVMITDLLRNDLGVIAKTGTVKVPKLFDIEKYYTLFQMTSTITAEAKDDADLERIFSALFPCGSITGAPKISTMEWISRLEDTPREVYCGSIGMIEPNGSATFNVAIRTVWIDHTTGTAEYGVGGGITWDSTPENEYAEILTKALLLSERNPDFELLESFKLEDGAYFLMDEHLRRICASAEYFQYRISKENIAEALHSHALKHPIGAHKVRLLVTKDGGITVESSELQNIGDSERAAVLAKTPVSRKDRFLYHKTTHRKVYEQHRKAVVEEEMFDVLLWNEEGEVTEFTTGNLVAELEGELLTPSRDCGLLAGTYRDYLLSSGVIKESVLTKADLKKAKQLWYINSVRGWIKIKVKSCMVQ